MIVAGALVIGSSQFSEGGHMLSPCRSLDVWPGGSVGQGVQIADVERSNGPCSRTCVTSTRVKSGGSVRVTFFVPIDLTSLG